LSEEHLSARAGELAQRWAVALIVARPLDALGEIPLDVLAREAPSLCAQALRAVRSEVELQRLAGTGAGGAREDPALARRLPAICGAREPAALIEAVEALRGVLWEALLGELTEASTRLVADVGDRLAYVCATMLATALAALVPQHADGTLEADPPSEGEPVLATEPGPLTQPPAPASSLPGGAVIVDERVPLAEPLAAAPAEIEIRDERREEGPLAWISSIGAQLERFERDGVPFAVLLVELLELERLRRQEPPETLLRLASGLEQALAAALGPWSGTITRERPGRCWLLVPETDRAGAERLAQRLMRELSERGGERQLTLAVAIGTALCPEDGREPATLAAHADVGLYAARSALRAAARPVSPDLSA
jgi:GGDEF domain-containing protein